MNAPEALLTPLDERTGVAPEAAHARALMDRSQTGLYVVLDGFIRYCNLSSAAMLGWPVDQLTGQPHAVVMAPAYRAHAQAAVQRRLDDKPGRAGDVQCQRRDGSLFDVRILARRIDFEGRPAVLVTLLDISELKDALRRAEWNASMLARTEALCRTGSFEVDWPSGRLRMSSGLRALLGLADTDPTDTDIDTLSWVPPEERAYVAGIWRNAVPDDPFEFQHRLQCADGRMLVVLHRGIRGSDVDGAARGVAILQDISAQRDAEQRIQDLANHHEVTGLPNRAWLLDQVDAAMHAARWESRGFALMAIEVPRIASVKANMGFGAGDTLAMAVAARLREACAGTEVVAQLADTEFALMLDTHDAEAVRGRALALRRCVEAPVRLGSTDVYPQCVIGVASFPADADAAGRLLECAQTARLDVPGGQGLAFFKPEANQRAMRAMQVESALGQAIENNEFQLHYQPQVSLSTGRIRGAEALLRWTSGELGVVSPVEFIPVAERTGLIGAIGEWVMRRACEQLAAWRRTGLPPLRLSVNLSPSQLQRPDLAQHVQALLLETGADPACLGIELTESMVMADVERASTVLRAIKAIGVEISLDDFGTGFSSLSCLCRLPIDVVKVDRSFVHDVTAPAQDVSVTRAIINMTHGLQMQALAEGVETEGQLALLAAAGCDQVQGYWFSQPVPADEFEVMVRIDKRLPERFISRRGAARARTLLLVDDEENILNALKRLLRRDGYRIVTAGSAAEGLQRLAEEDVDVIVSDQRMPGMTGVEFLHRAKDLYPDTLRMVLSGFTDLQSIIDAVNEGAIYKFLTKPWDDERLRGHVAQAFRSKEMADENRRLAHQVETANADLATLNDRLERLLGQQREQVEVLELSAGSMREVLDELPAAVLGIDPDGMVAFVNREAGRLLPRAHTLLGCALADTLTLPVGAGASTVTLDGLLFDVLVREMRAGSHPRGSLLMLLPRPRDA